jgi:hypothetical protein
MASTALLAPALLFAAGLAAQAPTPTPLRDLFADTWVGTDALGRTMPTQNEVGPAKTDHRRVVGIFYVTWHSDPLGDLPGPYGADVTQILARDPSARFDAKHPLWKWPSYHWAEPELGYFLSRDEYVIRKDMAMLSAAGVDVLVMDVTNAVCYWDEWDTVFSVMQKMAKEGTAVPRFCFWAFNGPVITVVQDLYDRIYAVRKYEDLWFHWDGKPLLLYNDNPALDANGGGFTNPNRHHDPLAKADPKHPRFGDPDVAEPVYRDYTKEVKAFFTLRGMWWGYHQWGGKRYVGTEDRWSFGLDLGDPNVQKLKPEERIATHRGRQEQAAVTPAQHASSGIGKSWTVADGEPKLDEHDLPEPTFVPWFGRKVEHPEAYGIYFQQRWDEALAGDPEFLYLNDWNEWTAGKYQPETGTTRFLGRDSQYFFVDQYNAEFNRGLQPMKGGYTDNYYMQMAQNIRRYKGARAIPELRGFADVKIDGDVTDWQAVPVEHRDFVGDTIHRDAKGYGGTRYVDSSGRNDIVSTKVAIGSEHVLFLAATKAPLTPCTDRHWMLLLLDSDRNPATGWYGYDHVVNLQVVDDHTTTLQRYEHTAGGDAWREVARVPFRAVGPNLEIAIPRAQLGLTGDTVEFDFKWSDNVSELAEPISLCTSGDAAPDRRFAYRCRWRK